MQSCLGGHCSLDGVCWFDRLELEDRWGEANGTGEQTGVVRGEAVFWIEGSAFYVQDGFDGSLDRYALPQ